MPEVEQEPDPQCAHTPNNHDGHFVGHRYKFGIPPMLHEKWWVAEGDQEPFTPQVLQRAGFEFLPGPADRDAGSKQNLGEYNASESSPEDYYIVEDARDVATVRGTMRLTAQQRWGVSAHLLPFIPYLENSIDGRIDVHQKKREGHTQSDTIRDWMQACEKLHGSRCGHVAKEEKGSWRGPIWLIDVVHGCLVHAAPGATYIALSYVWGGETASSCTTKSNIEDFRKENGLYGSGENIPRVITDAMELARSLDIPFLWVDRFCILQDDGIEKQFQLNAMGSIYANSCFTLVAAQNNDATQGLYGDEKTSETVARKRRTESRPATHTEVLLGHALQLMRTKWYSRGWTFQEYLLSKRRVVFHNNSVNWECLCASWHENQELNNLPETQESQAGKPRACNCNYTPQVGSEFESLPWPNMYRYARLVSLYNRHDLTYPEDVLDAFTGILTHLSRSFPGGFISGLPQMCFDAALLWQPWRNMTRRIAVRKSASEAVLPSWSWVGWAGDVNSESWRSAANYLFETEDEATTDQQCSWKTISTVKWTYSIDATSKRKEIRIPPEFAHRQSQNLADETLPPGWSAHRRDDGSGQIAYHHKCDPAYPFRYPIAIRDKYKAHIPPVTARYLYGTVKRGFLVLGPVYASDASDCPTRDLLTWAGEWAGVLRLDPKLCTEKIYGEEDADPKLRIVELVEISEGEVVNQLTEKKSFDEWNRPGFPSANGLYRFVNVLWIEWGGDVAYRKALGRVERRIWRSVANETIDITLG